jgi:hypothetical protein
MKTKHIIFSLLAVLAFAAVLTISGCKKDNVSESIPKNTEISQEEMEASKAMTAHILAFKERMAYFKQNPELKSGIYYTPTQAVIEVEAALSFTYCYCNVETNEQEYTTTNLIMPLENGEISESDLSIFQEDVIDEIQAHMAALTYPNKRLMVVDLEYLGDDGNGDALVGITSLVGNQQAGFLHADEWWYGNNAGTCNGHYAPEDAASQLQQRVIDTLLPAPPVSGRWYFTNTISEGYEALNYDPITTIDNYCDYPLFYAINTPPVLTIEYEEKCLSGYEMNFYENQYTDIAVTFENNNGLRKFKTCVVLENTEGSVQNPDWIEHIYTVTIGYRFVEYFEEVEDIENPN